jgi:hypothetical protein
LDISELNTLSRINFARQAFEHPSKLLGISVDKLMAMPAKDVIQMATDLEYMAKHLNLAMVWLIVGIMFRENTTLYHIFKQAKAEHIKNPSGYFPTLNLQKFTGVLIRMIEWQSIDKTMYATLDHYFSIDYIFRTEAVKYGNKLKDVGINPSNTIWAATNKKWVPAEIKKALRKVVEIVEQTEFTSGFDGLREVCSKYFNTVYENVHQPDWGIPKEEEIDEEEVVDELTR